MLSLLALGVTLFYAQTQTASTLAIANDSQPKIENNIVTTLSNTEPKTVAKTNTKADPKADPKADTTNTNTDTANTKGDNKLVKTTAMVRSSAMGMSRGSFSASAYCFSGRTAMGHPVRRGLIAADPRVLKMGSKVYIDAGPYSGEYTVSDTGGAIKGKKIDIWVPNCGEARRFGRRSVQIYSMQ